MVMYGSRDGVHRRGRDRHFPSVHSLATWPSTGEDLHCMCCCDLCLEQTMARVTRDGSPCLHRGGVVETGRWGQLPSEKGNMACHRQGRADPGGLRQAEHPLLETVGGPETLGMEDHGGPAGDGLPMRKGYPIFWRRSGGTRDGRAASHRVQEAESTDGEGNSGTEGGGAPQRRLEGAVQTVIPPPMEAPWWWRTPRAHPTGTAANPVSVPAPPSQQHLSVFPVQAHPGGWASPLPPGTSGPAPVSPAALSEEAIELLRSISVGQSTIVNAIQGLAAYLQQTNAFLEGIHSGMAAQQRSIQALASSLMAAIVPVPSLPLQLPLPNPIPFNLNLSQAHSQTSMHTG
ncbi:hypothetical protein NDU88_004074 [Pleurodeles waltl]|uniref:Uncharacterized protein n=1 Tax=Pleurodeles waltl TaxID=8319 RepID=A0AAV7QAU2_PLEWA|nr:hypothetical protein NDU88_004074 [Pleurodeles waltl]